MQWQWPEMAVEASLSLKLVKLLQLIAKRSITVVETIPSKKSNLRGHIPEEKSRRHSPS
uniref:Uncharacterized protein n=1 Tax=Rhizophora mucronata TaxID=61149 RepID=A0A2P2PVT1_RHIMU